MISQALILGTVKNMQVNKGDPACTILSLITEQGGPNHTLEQHSHTVYCYGRVAKMAQMNCKVGGKAFITGEINHRNMGTKHEPNYQYCIKAKNIDANLD